MTDSRRNTEREREIVIRADAGETHVKIASSLGISAARVSQIYIRAKAGSRRARGQSNFKRDRYPTLDFDRMIARIRRDDTLASFSDVARAELADGGKGRPYQIGTITLFLSIQLSQRGEREDVMHLFRMRRHRFASERSSTLDKS